MDFQDLRLLTTEEAASYLGFTANTLRNSRSTGCLAGVQSPPYRKMGFKVRYERSTLDMWLAQFEERTSTSQPG